MINVLAIDPSLSNWGMAVLELDPAARAYVRCVDLELVDSKPTPEKKRKGIRKSSDDLRRVNAIRDATSAIIARHDCRIAIAEVPSGCQSARGAFSNGACVGLLTGLPVPLVQISQLDTKEATGLSAKAQASKPDMIRWAVGRWPGANWIVGDKENAVGVRPLDGEGWLTLANEHLADACAAGEAGRVTDQMIEMMRLLR